VVPRRVKAHVRHTAAVHFRKYRLKPARMLVVDADRPHFACQFATPEKTNTVRLDSTKVGCRRQGIVSDDFLPVARSERGEITALL
jgi:hypothetical protein